MDTQAIAQAIILLSQASTEKLQRISRELMRETKAYHANAVNAEESIRRIRSMG